METSELKSRLQKYLEHADERVLKIFIAIIEAEERNLPASVQDIQEFYSKHSQNASEDEKSREEGIGSLKDDHRLK